MTETLDELRQVLKREEKVFEEQTRPAACDGMHKWMIRILDQVENTARNTDLRVRELEAEVERLKDHVRFLETRPS